MTLSTNSELARQYSQELAAYTLRQFATAQRTLDSHKAAADKLPAAHSRDYSKRSYQARKIPAEDARKLGDPEKNTEINVLKSCKSQAI